MRPDPKQAKVLPPVGDPIEETLKFLEGKKERVYTSKYNTVTPEALDEIISKLSLLNDPIYQDDLAEYFGCYYQHIGKVLSPAQKARMASHNQRIKLKEYEKRKEE